MKAFFPFLFVASLYATDIQTLISDAYENNPTLKKFELEIQSSDYDIKNSELYKNPVLSLGLNDINLDKPNSRDIEAMQTNFVTISQEITNSDKLEQKIKIAYINKQILQMLLKENRDKISKTIYTLAYNIKKLEEKIKLNEQKLLNIQEIKDYNSNNIQDSKAFQQTLKNELEIDTINLQIQIDKENIVQTLVSIAQIVNKDIKSVELVSTPNYKLNVSDHKLLKIQSLNIKKAYAKKILAKENESSDYTLSAGYYQRDSRDDYLSMAIKFPLNIYSKETNELEKSFKDIEISKNRYEMILIKLKKLYKVELSKYSLANKSIKLTEQMIKHLEKEKELIINQNNKDSVIGILDIENKIIDQKIKKLSFIKQKQVANVELAYLSSTLNKD